MPTRPLPTASNQRPAVVIFRSPLFNPSETFVQAQAAGLVRYQPLVVGLADKGGAIPALSDRLVLARPLESLRLRLGDPAPLARRLAAFPAETDPRPFRAGLSASPLARALGIPLVTSLRGYDVHRSRAALLRSGRLSWMRYAFARRRLAREGALFLAVSVALRDRAFALGFPEVRPLTHDNGVDLDTFHPSPEAPGERLILHVGRLVEKKGTNLLIEAFARIAPAFPEATLVIAGEGPRRRRLERQAAPLGDRSRIFAGALSPDAVAALMRRAWLLAAPSLTARDGDAEGLPNVVVEAAASGLPVVASAHAGIPEAVEHEKTGLIVAEGEIAPLAEALRTLLAAPALRHDFAIAARHLAEQRFDARLQSERLEALYDRVLRRRLSRSRTGLERKVAATRHQPRFQSPGINEQPHDHRRARGEGRGPGRRQSM